MIYLMNSLPNSLLFTALSMGATLTEVEASEVAHAVSSPDEYQDYDDNIAPREFTVTSAVGHETTAKLFEQIFECAIDAHCLFKPLQGYLRIPSQRINVVPVEGDILYCGLLCSQVRLEESRLYTKTELLALPLRWLKVQF